MFYTGFVNQFLKGRSFLTETTFLKDFQHSTKCMTGFKRNEVINEQTNVLVLMTDRPVHQWHLNKTVQVTIKCKSVLVCH